MKTGEQLKKLRISLHFSQDNFAKVLGVSAKSYWNYENDKRDIPAELISHLVHSFQLNPDWLFTGNGEMLVKPSTIEKIEQDINSKDRIFVPVRGEVEASMGYGVCITNEYPTGIYSISSQLAKDLGLSKDLDMIFAKGDSMFPTIEGGDSLLIDKDKTDIYDGKIYCIRIDGQLYAKRLQKIPPKKIKIVSDNISKYDPFYIDLSKDIDFDFEIIGEVRWWGRVAR